MKKPLKQRSCGVQWLLTTVVVFNFLFSQSALAGFDWPTVSVVKEGDVSGNFVILPTTSSLYETFTLAPEDAPRDFDVPYAFYVGEQITEMVDITITPSGSLLGGLELRDVFGFEYAGFAGICKGDCTVTFTNTNVSEVPLPAAAWLFGTGLIALAGIVRRG